MYEFPWGQLLSILVALAVVELCGWWVGSRRLARQPVRVARR